MRFLRPVGIAIDQLGNTLLGLIPPLRARGFGDPDWTVSAVLGQLTREGSGAARLFCRFLALFDEQHCAEALKAEEERHG